MSASITFKSRRNPKFRQIQPGPVYKYIHQGVTRLWKDSVKAFINEALNHVHVDTGMSAASFIPLGTKVRMKTILTQSLRGHGPKRGHSKLTGEFANNNADFKSRALGTELGKKAYHLSFGTPSIPKLSFDFKIVVFQYYLHETGKAKGSSDVWDSLEHGRVAFIDYFESNISNYIVSRVIAELIMFGESAFTVSGEVN